ncbi:MAG: HEAT repeat domain-containing protein [bacterium]
MELVKEAEQVIRELNRMLKTTWFYSASHPMVKSILQSVTSQLHAIIPTDGYLLFNISGETLSLGALPLSTKDENIRGFVKQLKKRRINSLIFYPEVGMQELEALMAVLALDPKLLRKQGGVKSALISREITHIDITEYQYQIGEAGSGATDEDSTSFAMLESTPDRISRIIQYLQGTVPELDAVESQLFSELMNDPMRIAELQAQAVQREVTPESSATVNELANVTRNVLTRIQQYINSYPEEEKEKLQRKVALSLLHQDPAVALHTVVTGKEIDPSQIETVKNVLKQLDDSELISLITASESDQHIELEKISSLFFKIPIETDRNEKLISKFTDLLIKRRENEQNEAEFTALQQELSKFPTNRMLVHSIAILLEMLEKGENVDSIPEMLQALQTGVTQLFEFREFNCLYDIYRSINQLLQKDSMEKLSSEQAANLQQVREFYTWLTEAQLINQLILALDATDTSVANVSFSGYEIDNSTANTNLTPDQPKVILDILAFIGDPAIPALLEKFKNYSARDPLHQAMKQLLVRFGDASIPHIEAIVQMETEPVQEQLLSIIGQIGSPRAKSALFNIIPKVNPSLFKSAIRYISQFTDDQSLNWMIDTFHKEKDAEIKLAALDGIAEIKSQAAIEFLINFISKTSNNKKYRALLHRAIQLCGKHKIADAVPTLITLFQQKSWLFPKNLEPIRIVSAQALNQIGTKEALEIVRAGCQDKRKAVRNMCQMLIEK